MVARPGGGEAEGGDRMTKAKPGYAIGDETAAPLQDGLATLSSLREPGRFYPAPAKMDVVNEVAAVAMPRAA